MCSDNDVKLLVESGRRLLDKIEAVVNSPSYQAVFNIAYIHGCQYTGPEFSGELEDFDDALQILEMSKP